MSTSDDTMDEIIHCERSLILNQFPTVNNTQKNIKSTSNIQIPPQNILYISTISNQL